MGERSGVRATSATIAPDHMTCLIIITGGISVALRVHQAWGEAFTCLPAIYDWASEENEEDPHLREIIHLMHVVSVQT